MAMEYFKISSKNTLIFGNSPFGIKAAKSSGANVVAIQQFKNVTCETEMVN